MYLGLVHTYVLGFGTYIYIWVWYNSFLFKLRVEFNCRDNRMKLGAIFDIKSFIQMI